MSRSLQEQLSQIKLTNHSEDQAKDGSVSHKQIEAIVYQNTVDVPVRGHERWYFESSDGRLPYLMVSKECIELLKNGKAAIVELGKSKHKLVNEEGARKIQNLSPVNLRMWNRQGSNN